LNQYRSARALIASIGALESRRLLSSASLPGENLLEECGGDALDAAFARNGADHDAGWYKPKRRVALDSAGGDANPTFDVNAAGLPLLTSRSDGAGMKIFLDFDGNGANLPFGIDGDDATFNAAEQSAIYDTWRDIISYFSAFNVNVTTVQPATGGQLFAWHLTSKSISGGYAYVNSLTNSGPTGFNEAGDGVGRHSGIAHEIGHIMGLSHQGEWDKLGVNVTEYTEGFGARDISIMGVDYGTNVRTWIYGRTSSSPSSLQNDVAVLASKAASVVGGDGYRPDDFGNTIATAYVVPANVQQLSAYTERYSDLDVFRINVSAAGAWNIDATPTYESASSPKIELLDAASNIIASRDDADLRNQRNNDVEFNVNLEPGTYYVRVSTSGDFSELGEYLLTASPLPDGFVTTDIAASLDRGGTASYDPTSGVLTQLAAGTDIWSSADQFRYTYDTIAGDGSITARILSIDNTDPNAKAGLMFRAFNTNTSAFVMIGVKPTGQIELIRRSSTSAAATTIASVTPGLSQVYLRLERAGTNYVGSYSSDGINWTTLGSATAVLSANSLVGFATTSHNTRKAAYSQFDQIALTGTLGEAAPTYNALPTPANLAVTANAGAASGVTITWDAVSGATMYHLERSVDGVNFTRIATPTGLLYLDNSLFGSVRWWYRVAAATNSTTGSVPSAAVGVVNKPSAPTVPSTAYAVPAISAPAGNAIYLNWTDVQGDQGYRIERSTNGSSFTVIATTPTNINAYNDNSAAPSTGYQYRITPITSVGDGQAPSLIIEAGTRWTTSAFRTVARSSSSISLAWADFGTETGYRVERTTNGVTGWGTVATLPANQTTWSNTGLSALTEYYYRVVADLPLSEIISSTIAFASTLPTAALPLGWSVGDVGTVGGWGASGSTDGGSTYKVVGGGTDIGGSVDSMHYLYRPLNGDGSITVRVASQKNNDIDDNAEAGIMIRESLLPNSKYTFVNVEPGRSGRTDFESRSSTGGSITNTEGTTTRAPIWMRLTRAGSTFTAEYSTNGSTWTVIGTRSITMAAPVYIGMAVSAVEQNLLSFATFSNVSISGDTSANQKPTITSPAYAAPSPVTGTTTALHLFATDDAGEANLTYTWSAPGIPSGQPAPTFGAANGTNAARNITATFGGSGAYTLRVTVADAAGLISVSDVNVNVVSTFTSLAISPADGSIAPAGTQAFTVTGRDQFGNDIASPSVTWTSSNGSIGSDGVFTAPAVAGPVTITATSGTTSASTTAIVNLVSSTPLFSRDASELSFTLNGDVAASLSLSDLVLTNLTTGQVIPAGDLTLATSGALTTVRVRHAAGVFPDGHYQLTVAASEIALASGQSLSAPISFNFSFKLGDVTGDNAVNFDDLLALAQNYGQSQRTYSQGDLNYDGAVTFDDLLILAQRYGTSLAQVAAPVPQKQTTKQRSTTASRLV
jgi:regulation of enolase protein 1 (concanavalin A-like superfamily)